MSDGELAVVEAEAELAKAHARNALAEWSLQEAAALSSQGAEAETVYRLNECEAICTAQDVIVAEARLRRAKALLDFCNKPEK